MMICFYPATIADPEGILHFADFHLGLHCLPKYPFVGIKNEGLIISYFARFCLPSLNFIWDIAIRLSS